jgi:hypothetical protein
VIDGGIEHAVERIFSTAAVVAGYRLADSDGRAVLQSEPAVDRETAR